MPSIGAGTLTITLQDESSISEILARLQVLNEELLKMSTSVSFLEHRRNESRRRRVFPVCGTLYSSCSPTPTLSSKRRSRRLKRKAKWRLSEGIP